MANNLAAESSPYLLQHAQNPVHWYAWGDEPFAQAAKDNKPVLVSIGYAACHWCHVMEHESFENEEVAAFMNEHFICIKVDREEHPGVDHFYMDAVQAISGSGGWPLNVFTTPQRIPFYGGTYYPPKPLYGRASWMQVLQQITAIWKDRPEEVAQQTGQMLQYLQQASKAVTQPAGDVWDAAAGNHAAENLLKQADAENGGFGRAPKFPGTMAINYLLQHYYYTKDEACLQHALKSLDAMIAGGIYDQVGGGFARYATDDAWLVPHFEKMLYDNALLILSLCDAYSITKKQQYKQVIEDTIAFVERELKDASGGYYSALDADSEGVEGKYYTWTWDEWNKIIKDDLVTEYFGVTEAGNWEHTNILHVPKDAQQLAAEKGIGVDELIKRIAVATQTLFDARQPRIRPLTDDKSLLSWNALMNTAMVKAGLVLNNEIYLQKGEMHILWMLENFKQQDVWMHTWKKGKARIAANLDDIAYLIKALLQLASASGKEQYIIEADQLTAIAFRDFISDDGSFFYYTSSSQHDVPVRKMETYDGATPSANAVMAENLLWLSMVIENTNYAEQADAMLNAMASAAKRYTYSYAYWAMLQQGNAAQLKTIVCTGANACETGSKLAQYYIPASYILTSQKEISEIPVLKGRFSQREEKVYVCNRESCLPPMQGLAQVLEYLHAN